jgi:hypothetical protein
MQPEAKSRLTNVQQHTVHCAHQAALQQLGRLETDVIDTEFGVNPALDSEKVKRCDTRPQYVNMTPFPLA